MCKKPCLFFQSGQCTNTSNCNFCHLPHPHRASHLDKRNRELLTNLDFGTHIRILLDALRSRARLVPFQSAANRFVDVLVSQCADFGVRDAAPVQDQRSLKKLWSALQGQVFSSLISLFFKVASNLEAPVNARIQQAYVAFQDDIVRAELSTMHSITP